MTKKNAKLVLLLLVTAIVLTGCAAHTATGEPGGIQGFIYSLIGKPIQQIMLNIGNTIGQPNGIGWGLIIITGVLRLILLPLMINQQSKSLRHQERMKLVKPQTDLIQKAVKNPATTQEQKMQINQLQMQVYRENNMSITGGIGCLPLIIQLPFLMGIYQSIQYSQDIVHSSFFGISLGSPSVIITVIATLLYVIQSFIMYSKAEPEQKQMMKTTAFISPLVTFFISISTPGGISLYFLVGGIVVLIQQLVMSYILQPRIKRQSAEANKDTEIVEVVTPKVIDDILKTNSASTTKTTNSSANATPNREQNRQRNAGKQNKKD
ncbi:membrane protein insertase YidC [Holzapfeliella sp. He02]|uniref:Membrane protein insertase YidC n=1 Tax=Holzapfeliella saturejae TaxID=3082953 RepID=A0ABU8SGX3_9LACO